MFLLFLLGSLFIAIHIPAVQTKIVQKAAEVLSETIDHKVTIGSVDIDFFRTVVLNDVDVLDYQDNELLHIGKLDAEISAFTIFNPDKLYIDQLTLTEPRFHLIYYEGSDSMNVSTFIRALSDLIKSDSTQKSKPFEFKIDAVQINNGLFVYDNQNKPYSDYGLDYQHMDLDSIYGNISGIEISGDSVFGKVRGLRTVDKNSGTRLNKLDVDMTYAPTYWVYDNMDLRTGKSNLRHYVRFDYEHFGNFTEFIDSVHVTASLDSSVVFGEDLAKFAPQLRDYAHEKVLISGDAKGLVKNFSTKNLDVFYGQYTHVKGDVSVNGLPEIKETFFELKLQPSTLFAQDLKEYIPENAFAYTSRLGIVNLSGQFIGFYNDFVANGSFATALGRVSSDINLKLEDNSRYSSYRGYLKTENFNVGRLINDTKIIKSISMNGRVEGTGFKLEDARLKLDATINAINIYDYNYRNITTNATLSKQLFVGDIKIKDPNLQFAASGTVNLNNQNQVFNLTANLNKADFQALKLSNKNLVIETNAKLDFTGIKLDDIIGTSRFYNSIITYEDKQLEVDTIDISSVVENGIRNLNVNSSLFNFTAVGAFSYKQVVTDIETLITEYQLNFENNAEKTAAYYSNKPPQTKPEYKIDYTLRLKEINPLLHLFVPEVTISENTDFEGEFRYGNTSIFNLFGQIDTLIYGNTKLYSNNLEASFSKLPNTSDVLASAFFTSINQNLPSIGKTENFYVEGVWNERTIAFSTNLDQTETTNKANISGNINFLIDNVAEIVFNRSRINILDKEWHISQNNTVTISGKEIEFNDFSLSHRNQRIGLSGFISEDPAKTLHMEVDNFRIQNLNPILDEKMRGLMNAELHANDMYNQAMINSNLAIDSLYFGDILIGDVTGQSGWNNRMGQMDINIGINRDNIKKLSVTGYYNPRGGDEQLNLLAVLDGAEMKLVEPLLKDIMHDLSGSMEGRVRVLGRLTAPVLKGNVLVKNGRFNFSYLNTVYNFTDRVYFSENGITFRNVALKDIYGNQGTLTGGVYHDGFQNMLIDMKASFNKFMVLNTTRAENELFYGSAFASGSASVFGPPSDLKVNITATSEKGTRMFIPLDNQAELTRQNFIKFVNRNTADSVQSDEIVTKKIDLSGINLNFDLTVTEDAYAEIIFDEKAGDIIRGVGNGRIQLNIDTRGEFNMYGQYEISRGAYNFVFYDVVNKEFMIRPGGVISWNGDPYSGNLNVTATYTQRASLPFLNDNTTQDNPVAARYPVTIVMNLEGNLLAPQINLSLEFNDIPGGIVQDQVNAYMTSIRNDEQELNRQVFSLLFFKRLSPPGEFDFQGAESVALGSLSEVLSNYLSSWLSQVDNNLELDIGVEGLTPDQRRDLQVRIGYSFLSGRLRVTREGGINAAAADQTGAANTNTVIGDWTVEYYLRPDGKLRLRMEYETQRQVMQRFDQTNTARSSTSILHTESFDSFGELLSSFGKLFTSNKAKKEAEQAEKEKERIILDSEPRMNFEDLN